MINIIVQNIEEILNSGCRVTQVRVIERNGLTLSQQLCNKTPWRRERCQEPACIPCGTQPGACRKSNVTYRMVCIPCAAAGISSVYIGESHRTWGDRAGEHAKALEKFNKSYATVRHSLESHPGQIPMYTFHQIGCYQTS